MKYVDEYRSPELIQKLATMITKITTRPWTIMEVCGGQTHAIVKNGLDQLLPSQIRLIHGPGCPVCVTSEEFLDNAIELALRHKVILCTFGDMLRVPASTMDLQTAKALGADVRIIYSPLETLDIAEANPERETVLLAVGFETTAPIMAFTIQEARKRNLNNFSALVHHVLVPPALNALLENPKCVVQGFLAAGHVCTIMGEEEYHPISQKYKVPIVVTGFEPVDILEGIYLTVKQLEEGRFEVENQYARAAKNLGNLSAQESMLDVFEKSDSVWRGLGAIPLSGLRLREKYKDIDALRKFSLSEYFQKESLCESGSVLQGLIQPSSCKQFGKACTPLSPLGAPMVSSEGACSAYYRFKPGTQEAAL